MEKEKRTVETERLVNSLCNLLSETVEWQARARVFDIQEAAAKLNSNLQGTTLKRWIARARKIAKKRNESFDLISGRYLTERSLTRLLDLLENPNSAAAKRPRNMIKGLSEPSPDRICNTAGGS